ncbi:hypothetical protein A2U01_0057377, partial [Trifolium medium]|nr:hypothetical protein [Trifolium medium]
GSSSSKPVMSSIEDEDCELANDNEVNAEGELVQFALLAGAEPINYVETLKDQKWKKSMEEELNAKKPIALKWVHKVKHLPDSSSAKVRPVVAITNQVNKGKLSLEYCPTDNQKLIYYLKL